MERLLLQHTKKFEGSFGYVAGSMARDLSEIHERFQRGATSEARFLLHQVVENCSTCHMKLPDPGHAPKTEQFFKDVEISKLSPFEQARLKVALRQFEDAAKSWEELFTTWANPSEIFAMDALVDYLKVSIRVLGNPKRAQNMLTSLSAKAAIPKFLKREIQGWRDSLAKIDKDFQKPGLELNRARKYMQNAKRNMEYPLDRVGVVDFIAASALLNRFVDSGKATNDQQAEAYFLLGNCESLIGRSAWLSQGEYYYEAAIRTAPRSIQRASARHPGSKTRAGRLARSRHWSRDRQWAASRIVRDRNCTCPSSDSSS